MAKNREETKQELDAEKNIEEVEEIIPKEVESGIVLLEEGIPLPRVIAPEGWQPKTQLGKDVLLGKITNIDQLFSEGIKITEPGIVDTLISNLENEIILIGGSTGKGGGIRRTPTRRTTRMHKSGRRFKISVMIVAGNKDGYVGLGLSSGPPGKHREVIQKALNRAKLNVIPIRRGCGSWECKCSTSHSIPFAVEGKSGSVVIQLKPAPKGVGLVVSNEVKKLMRLGGIRDIWCKTRGKTQSRVNLLKAAFETLKKLNRFKTREEYEVVVGLKLGRAI